MYKLNRHPLSLSKVCGVSILRAGEVLEPALLSVCKDATLGKILIQTNPNTGEPEVRHTYKQSIILLGS